MKLKNYLVNVAFDGQEFNGTQIQKNKPTIQGVFEDRLSNFYNKKIKISCCSRLDSKVSALDFYFSFIADDKYSLEEIKNYLNKVTPRTIYIKNIRYKPLNFSAHHYPHYKEYIYCINNGITNPLKNRYLLDIDYKIDIDKLKEALKLFEGEHDFSSFSALTNKKEKDQSFKSIIFSTSVKFKERGKIIIIHISGKTFFKYQVRMIVGSCLLYASNHETLDNIKKKLYNPNLNSFKIKLPAYPLILYKTTYIKKGEELC